MVVMNLIQAVDSLTVKQLEQMSKYVQKVLNEKYAEELRKESKEHSSIIKPKKSGLILN